ncbi:hypothetical protein [Microbacterium sp.]|uniref:hypothetical protein n=1 Tax=Microbacterium sp. TaxID=51671 RepID=UPI0039E5166D
MSPRRSSAVVSAVGVGAVVLYAAVAALQILVLNPLAAAPGRTLAEIRGEMSAAGETLNEGMALGILGVGVVIALVVAAISIRSSAPAALTAMLFCGVLTFGAPAYFAASFGAGMGLADTYGISGGDHAPWGGVLFAVSLLAFGAAVGLAVTVGRAPRRIAAPA